MLLYILVNSCSSNVVHANKTSLACITMLDICGGHLGAGVYLDKCWLAKFIYLELHNLLADLGW